MNEKTEVLKYLKDVRLKTLFGYYVDEAKRRALWNKVQKDSRPSAELLAAETKAKQNVDDRNMFLSELDFIIERIKEDEDGALGILWQKE